MSNVQIIGDNLGQAKKEGAVAINCGSRAFRMLAGVDGRGDRILMHLRIEDLQAIQGLPVIENESMASDEIHVIREDGSVWKQWRGVR